MNFLIRISSAEPSCFTPDSGEPQLVCVGAQECNYARESRRSTLSGLLGKGVRRSSDGDAAAADDDNDDDDDDDDSDSAEQPQISSPRSCTVATATVAAPSRRPPDASFASTAESYASRRSRSAAPSATSARSRAVAVAEYLRGQVDSSTAWERHISAALGPRYCLLASRSMFQTRLLLYCRTDVLPHVAPDSIATDTEATGIGR